MPSTLEFKYHYLVADSCIHLGCKSNDKFICWAVQVARKADLSEIIYWVAKIWRFDYLLLRTPSIRAFSLLAYSSSLSKKFAGKIAYYFSLNLIQIIIFFSLWMNEFIIILTGISNTRYFFEKMYCNLQSH